MREIKFRVWSDFYNDWVESFCIKDGRVHLGNAVHYPGNQVNDAILMQFTGLKDKNGKEIYEGDVVDTVYDGKLFTGVIIYDESELDFKATNGEENYGSNFQYLPCCDEVEVIGNIYENPKLIKTK